MTDSEQAMAAMLGKGSPPPAEARKKRDTKRKTRGTRLNGKHSCELSSFAEDTLQKLSQRFHLVESTKGMHAYYLGQNQLGFKSWLSCGSAALSELSAQMPGVLVAPGEDRKPYLLNAGEAYRYWTGAKIRKGAALLPPPLACPDDWLNLWAGYEVQPAPGDVTPFEEYVYDVLCSGNEDMGWYVMQWLGHMVQRPGEKPGTALILLAGEGAGKGTLGEILREIFGMTFQSSSLKQLVGRFAAFAANLICILVDEASTRNEDQEDRLKNIITEIQQTTEKKGMEAEPTISLARVILTSNNMQAVRASKGSRRFIVPRMNPDYEANESNPRHAEATAYWREFHDWWRGNVPAIFDYLLSVSLDGFDRYSAPESDRKAELVLENLKPMESFLVDYMDRPDFGKFNTVLGTKAEQGLITCRVVVDAYCEHLNVIGYRGPDLKPNRGLSTRMGKLLTMCWGASVQKADGLRYFDVSDFENVAVQTCEALGIPESVFFDE